MTLPVRDPVVQSAACGFLLLALLAGAFLPSGCRDGTAGKPAYSLAARSPRWGGTRDAFVAKNATCAFCGRKADEVHQITPVHVWPEGELVTTNLVSLCVKHHFEWGHLGDWRAYNPNVLKHAEWYRKVMAAKSYKKRDGEGGK